jgi:sterol 3beta-glucosyltransferase
MPLVLTFASMPFVSGISLTGALEQLTKELKVRLIVIKGWGLYDTTDLATNKSIKVVESAPYDKLFPLVKAVIHHGGIGTISACILAGKPFFACPVMYPFGDQYFWAMIGRNKGIAVTPIPLKKLTEPSFINGVKELLGNKLLYENSKRLSEQLKSEDGIQNALQKIESL